VSHDVCPNCFWYKPDGHVVQDVYAEPVLNVPLGQSTGSAVLSAQYLPISIINKFDEYIYIYKYIKLIFILY